LLKQVLDHSVKYKSRILYLSSAAVYKIPNNKKKINETSDLDVGTFPGEIIYVNSKISGENLCKIYREKYKLPIYIARPAHTYGPGQDFKDPRYIPQILKRAMKEKKIYIFNDPKKAIKDADVIFSDKVISLNDKGNKKKKIQAFKNFRIDKKLTNLANKNFIFLHCLPRGKEVSEDVFSGKHSHVWLQAMNRVHVQKSILLYCFGKLR